VGPQAWAVLPEVVVRNTPAGDACNCASGVATAFRTRGVFITAGALSREAPGLLVEVASAEYLLATKLFSSRVEADAEDIALLYREVGYRTVEEGLALVERSYPGRPIAARVQFLLAEIVEALNAQ
jgi:hypothetical protein